MYNHIDDAPTDPAKLQRFVIEADLSYEGFTARLILDAAGAGITYILGGQRTYKFDVHFTTLSRPRMRELHDAALHSFRKLIDDHEVSEEQIHHHCAKHGFLLTNTFHLEL